MVSYGISSCTLILYCRSVFYGFTVAGPCGTIAVRCCVVQHIALRYRDTVERCLSDAIRAAVCAKSDPRVPASLTEHSSLRVTT